MSSKELKRNFTYSFDLLIEGNPALRDIQNRSISTPAGGNFFLLLSVDPNDETEPLQLTWDDTKLSVAEGALQGNQLQIFYYHKVAGEYRKWKPKDFNGHVLHYGMWCDYCEATDHRLVLRQYCKPKRDGLHARFLFIPFTSLIQSLNPESCSQVEAV